MWSDKYIHIPFADHGRSKNGCDCWGLVTVIYKENFNVDLPLLLAYDNIKDVKHITDLCQNECERWEEIPLGEERPFDVLVFNILGAPCHVGVIIEKGLVLHCEKGIGTHVSEYYKEKQWCLRIAGIYRYVK